MKHINVLLAIVLSMAIIGTNNSAFAGDGKISGYTYFDYTHDLTSHALNDEGFQVRRLYFTYQQELSEGLKFKLQTDIDYSKSPKNLYVKNAKVDWTMDFGELTLGLQGMNVFNIQEKTWGYRFIEKSAMDRYKFSSSADFGVGFSKTAGKNLHLSALLTNGTGYKSSENDDKKKLSLQGFFGEKNLSKKDGFNAGGVVSFEPYNVDSATTEAKSLIGFFGGFSSNGLRTGVEYDLFSDGGTNVSKSIISFYANYEYSADISFFGKFDIYDPNTDLDEDGENYLVAGVSYSPQKGLTIAPNICLESPEEGDSQTVLKLNFLFKY